MYDIEIKNDKARNTQIQNKRLRGIIDSQIDTRIEDVNERKKIVDKELKILQIKNKLKQKDLPESTKKSLNDELTKTKGEIDFIVENYSKVDRRTKDVRARKKTKQEAAQAWKDTSLKKTIKFAEEGGKKIGKSIFLPKISVEISGFPPPAKTFGIKS